VVYGRKCKLPISEEIIKEEIPEEHQHNGAKLSQVKVKVCFLGECVQNKVIQD
jgi:hypothetical protein